MSWNFYMSGWNDRVMFGTSEPRIRAVVNLKIWFTTKGWATALVLWTAVLNLPSGMLLMAWTRLGQLIQYYLFLGSNPHRKGWIVVVNKLDTQTLWYFIRGSNWSKGSDITAHRISSFVVCLWWDPLPNWPRTQGGSSIYRQWRAESI